MVQLTRPIPYLTLLPSTDVQLHMAKIEIYKRTANIWSNIWWNFLAGPEVYVKWPVGNVRIKQEDSDLWDYVRSADPNDHYRPWLEEHVGKQGKDWAWRIGNANCIEVLTIKFLKKHKQHASIVVLKWS